MKHIRQAGLKSTRVTGVHAAYSKVATAKCVVIAVRYIDDPLNISKTHVEYDVRDLRTGQIYPNAQRADQTQGMDDGCDDVLRPAQKLVGVTSPVFDPKVAQLSASDGDFVEVIFSYGAQHSPVIVGVTPHPSMSYGTTKAQGFRRFQTHKGTSVETQADGTYQIKRNDTTITLNPNEDIIITHKSGSLIKILDSGDIQVVPARNLLLGSDQANLQMARETDSVQVSIPIGVVMVPGVPSPVPNSAPIPLNGQITSGSSNVKG